MATNNNNNVQIKQENENNYLEFDNHVIFTYINQWENHSISKIQLAAQQARNDLKQLFTKNRQDFINLLNQVNKEVDENLNTSNNLTKCTEQLNKLRKDLSNMSSYIHLEHDKTKSPIYLIKLFHKNKNQTKQIDNDTNDDYIIVPGTEPLILSMLNNVPPNEQKQMLGERLFVLVQQIEPNLAAKITGMFLELDIKYILILIKSHSALKSKIKEAIDVLQAYRYKQPNVFKMVISVIQKLLPLLNFVIASTALGFQVSVLHPWHHRLDHDLNSLQHHQEAILHEYEEVKMPNIKNIEEYLIKFNIDRAEDQ